ncbi:YicC/YloC family endoribonuclease [Proteiniclasticum ruminis]|uniref:TIGR00255 family protein n=1 Tax=Proteiniclasticum ruminis TaxID=398199 RepID=A0A1G8G888_9CLOT|nr:YicC/YloC family endoribonuclease [Proteiniclasticum ruminis]SDH90614.1 TIGR00255 family protein [Proteiniclasticum ruminis]
MIKSMTGFGRGMAEDEKRSFLVEMRGVNHRYLDFSIRMPKSLMSLEDRVRKEISKVISRGKLDVFITYRNYAKEDLAVQTNLHLAKGYVDALNSIKDSFSLKDDISVSLVSRFPDVIFTEEKEENIEEIWALLEEAVREASLKMLEMKKAEGTSLKNDMLQKKEGIIALVDKIRERDKLVIPLYKERLEKRIEELLEKVPVDESRLALEVAMYTDKASIDEELTRLSSHMEQLENFLKEEEPVGRKLDFLAQEMNREANTMASKSVDIEITNVVLSIKNEIEKIREQMQNIE